MRSPQATDPATPSRAWPGVRYTQVKPVMRWAWASSTFHRNTTPCDVACALSSVNSRPGSNPAATATGDGSSLPHPPSTSAAAVSPAHHRPVLCFSR